MVVKSYIVIGNCKSRLVLKMAKSFQEYDSNELAEKSFVVLFLPIVENREEIL